MTSFRAAEQIVREFAVGEARLAAYAHRGNLPMLRVDGEVHYDITVVERLFKRRGAQPELGAGLGAFRLGDVLGEAPEPRTSSIRELGPRALSAPTGSHS
jgi:hypothetical protein